MKRRAYHPEEDPRHKAGIVDCIVQSCMSCCPTSSRTEARSTPTRQEESIDVSVTTPLLAHSVSPMDLAADPQDSVHHQVQVRRYHTLIAGGLDKVSPLPDQAPKELTVDQLHDGEDIRPIPRALKVITCTSMEMMVKST